MEDKILTILNKIQKDVAEAKFDIAMVKEKLTDLEPVYGSDEWWEWSDRKGLEDLKQGRYTSVSSIEELSTLLDSWKKPSR